MQRSGRKLLLIQCHLGEMLCPILAAILSLINTFGIA